MTVRPCQTQAISTLQTAGALVCRTPTSGSNSQPAVTAVILICLTKVNYPSDA